MSYPANAEQGQRMIDALSGNPVASAGDVTKNRSPFNAEQAEVIIELLENGGGGSGGTASAVSYDNTASGYRASDVQGAVDESAAIIKGQQRQITALRNLLEGVAYSTETDTTAAYAKTVPSGAQAVSVNSFGGHSEVVENEIVSAEVTEIESKSEDAASLGSIALPSALLTFLADKGYGWSAGTAYNEVDFANKKYIQRVREKELSEISWEYDTVNQRFKSVSTDDTPGIKGSTRGTQLLCKKYEVKSNGEGFSSAWDNAIYVGNNAGNVYIHDHVYTDAETFSASLVGNTLYYELAEPVEYDISEYLPTDEAFNFLLTEPGGALTFKQNDNTELSVPQSLVWAIKNSEVTA